MESGICCWFIIKCYFYWQNWGSGVQNSHAERLVTLVVIALRLVELLFPIVKSLYLIVKSDCPLAPSLYPTSKLRHHRSKRWQLRVSSNHPLGRLGCPMIKAILQQRKFTLQQRKTERQRCKPHWFCEKPINARFYGFAGKKHHNGKPIWCSIAAF